MKGKPTIIELEETKMKKFVAIMMLVALTLSLGMAQAEVTTNFAKDVLKSNASEVQVDSELLEKANKAFGGEMTIKVTLIETNGVSAGEAKYQSSTKAEERSWFGKVLDFVTFWN